MKVLITSPRGKEHLVDAFKKTDVEVVKTLEEGVKLIIPTVDEELPFFAQARPWFNQQGIEVMVSNPTTIDLCRDKAEFARVCARHGVSHPRTSYGENFIVKPRFGKGSRGIIRPEHSHIVQETITFPEVSIDYFADFEGKCLSMIARYRLNVTNGESTDMQIVADFDYTDVKRFGEELKLIGHNVIQGFWTGKTFIFSEINLRFGGGSWMTFDIFNSPEYLINSIKEKV